MLVLAPAAAAATKGALAPGPLNAERVTYDAGELALTARQEDGSGTAFEQPLEGSVTFPASEGPWPVALFLHGRHQTCVDAEGAEFVPDPEDGDPSCPELFGPDGRPTQTPILNYAGYDYISSYLATNGYAVISPSANVIHSFDGDLPDGGATLRAELVGATLDLLTRWNEEPGPGAVGDRLIGRLDLGRIVLMGHSRGGEGVTEFISLNGSRERVYPLSGVLALAPTDVTGRNPFRGGAGTNLAELLPGCDGDVVDLEGGHAFERAKYAGGGAEYEKFQWLVEGTNHNWFNTVWTVDDARGGMFPPLAEDSACDRRSPSTVRLDREGQRAAGIALIGGFVRRFSGGETGFDPLLRGRRWSREACRAEAPLACRAARSTSYVGPQDQRRTLIGPGGSHPADRNALGEAIRSRGLARLGWCDPTGAGERQARRCPGPPEQSGRQFVNRSETKQLVVTWDRRSALRTAIGAAGDAGGFRELVLRTVTTLSPRNPIARGNRVVRSTQRFDVVLEDRDGDRSRAAAERFSTAPAPSVGDGFRNLILSDVRIPLGRFDGVELSRLRALELQFGVRGRKEGQIQLSDVAFEGGR